MSNDPQAGVAIVAELHHKCTVMELALREIANEDFRGNRPDSAIVAYNALKSIGIATT